MNTPNLLERGRPRFEWNERLDQTRGACSVDHRGESLGTLGMAFTSQMIEVRLVGDEQHRHRRRRYREAVITGVRIDRRDDLPRLLDDGRVRARLRRWPGSPEIAHLILADHTRPPGQRTLDEWLGMLDHRGFGEIRTGALAPSATDVFRSRNFRPIQELVLLQRNLARAPRGRDGGSAPRVEPLHHELRALRGRRQLATAARIDAAAFAIGWHLDEIGIVDAANATPQSRVRLAVTSDDEPAGYMITGRNGTAGFVQRLAVDPRFGGRGVARALLTDGIEWLRRRGATEVLVNTDLDNDRALDLYSRHGFRETPERLVVLARRIDSASGVVTEANER